jgi:hypothetical protein
MEYRGVEYSPRLAMACEARPQRESRTSLDRLGAERRAERFIDEMLKARFKINPEQA